MMKNIKVKGFSQDDERKVRLINGTLVFHLIKNELTGVYIVTSFRNSYPRGKSIDSSQYCSLVDLDTGKIAFEEPCSRYTTEKRVISHLNQIPQGFDQIRIYKSGDYEIEISPKNESFLTGREA